MKHLSPKGWRTCKASVRPCPYQQSEFQVRVEPKAHGAYYAAPVPEKQISSFIEKFRKIEPNWKEYEAKKTQRDRGRELHITVLTPRETRSLKRRGVKIKLPEFQIEPVGVGKALEEDNVSYFVIIKSKEINEYRASLGLPPHDLHVTLGFKQKDIHGVPKDKTTLI